jgi:hypothetical protein
MTETQAVRIVAIGASDNAAVRKAAVYGRSTCSASAEAAADTTITKNSLKPWMIFGIGRDG